MTASSRLLNPADTVLVVIDIQERLVAAMEEKVARHVIERTELLCFGAAQLNVPIMMTEQYPKGLGATVEQLRLETVKPHEKISFSCLDCRSFEEELRDKGRNQVVLAGMETHICVYQTAVALVEQGYQVTVPLDAVCSRRKENWRNGLDLMRGAGVSVSNSETVLFELLREASGDAFKAISKRIK